MFVFKATSSSEETIFFLLDCVRTCAAPMVDDFEGAADDRKIMQDCIAKQAVAMCDDSDARWCN